MIPGHPWPGGRLGTKDAQDQFELLQTASAEIRKLAQEGKCWAPAENEYKSPQYEKWPGYAAGLPLLARRYCGFLGSRNLDQCTRGCLPCRRSAHARHSRAAEGYGPRQKIRAN